MMRTYTTQQVANALRINKRTLFRWLADGKIREPRRVRYGGLEARVWTVRDVEKVRKYKAAHYWEGRGVKKKQGAVKKSLKKKKPRKGWRK